MRRVLQAVSLLLATFLYSVETNSQKDPPDQPSPTFVRGLSASAPGTVIIACEENGLFVANPPYSKARQVPCLAEAIPVSLAVDSRDRIWIGCRKGGAVWLDLGGDATSRRAVRYPALSGIGGTYVPSVLCRRDGTWFTTENGIAWRKANGEWLRFHSKAGGLPTGPVDIVVLPDGTLCAAGANGGLARLRNEYSAWAESPADQLLRRIRINGLAADDCGRLFVAAQEGLFFQQGQAWTRFSPAADGVCREDPVTCVATTPQGRVLCGTRKGGLLLLDPATDTWQVLPKGENGTPGEYVSAVLPLGEHGLVVGTYGHGFRFLPEPRWGAVRTAKRRKATVRETPDQSRARYVGCDRDTQGDWVGRYGTSAWVLAAMGRPYDFVGGPASGAFRCAPRMGARRRQGDSVRHWVHWLGTDDTRSLRCPVETGRRQASWDDAGELYPPEQDGPNLLLDLDVPAGDWFVSLYFVNIDAMHCPSYWKTSDGFYLPNRFRDYEVEVFHRAVQPTGTPLANCRVNDFIGGVYYRFRIGEGTFTIRVRRMLSHNTMLSAVFLDSAIDAGRASYLIERSFVATERLDRLGSAVDNSAIDTAIRLHRNGLFEMAENVLGNTSETFLSELAEETSEAARDRILRQWEKSCIRVQRGLHVSGQLHLAVHGHDPDRTSAVLFVPYVSALMSSPRTSCRILDLADTLMADAELCGLIRKMFPFVPSILLPTLEARMASCQTSSRPFLRQWLTHPRTALQPREFLVSLLADARHQGRELTVETITNAEETPEN
jgi:hypothetical protein